MLPRFDTSVEGQQIYREMCLLRFQISTVYIYMYVVYGTTVHANTSYITRQAIREQREHVITQI